MSSPISQSFSIFARTEEDMTDREHLIYLEAQAEAEGKPFRPLKRVPSGIRPEDIVYMHVREIKHYTRAIETEDTPWFRWCSLPEENVMPSGITVMRKEVRFWRETESNTYRRTSWQSFLDGEGQDDAQVILGPLAGEVEKVLRDWLEQESFDEGEE